MASAFNAQPGDLVVMKMDSEARSWGRKGPPNETKGTLVGYTRATVYEGRTGVGRFFREAGVYERDGAPLVLWEKEVPNLIPELASIHDLEFADPEVGAKRRAEYHALPESDFSLRRDLADHTVRIGDLPETKFWEGDIVNVPVGHDFYNPDFLLRVTSIQFYWVKDDVPADPRGMCYQVEFIHARTHEYARGGSTYLHDDILTLVERGPVWKEEHGEPLIFASLMEEANFHNSVGRTTEIRNPSSKLYSWTKDEALDAIRIGIADSMSIGPLMFNPGKTSISVRRFKDRDVGERVRAATMEGFGFPPPVFPPVLSPEA